MNLRQAHHSLSELIAKCEAAHVELPENPLDARAEALESIIHSLKDGRPNLKDALEELQQKFGIQVEWRQHRRDEEPKRLDRRQSNQKRALSIHKKEDVKLTQSDDGESVQYQSSRTATVTRMKQQSSRKESSVQETAAIQVSKTSESSRDAIICEASDETEKKLPLAPLENVVMDNDSKSILPGSPDQEMIDLLEDLDEDEDNAGDSDTSSDKDEEIDKVHDPNIG